MNMNILLCLVSAIAVSLCTATVYFQEQFDDDWEQRWVNSEHRDGLGKFKLSAGKFYNDAKKDRGIQTSTDAKFYATSAKFDSFSNADKDLIVQFTVKHEQKIDCGGGYFKLFPSQLDQTDMHGDSAYNIMFGPDICGPGTKKVHVIFSYKGQNLLIKKDIRCKDDEFTHLYTLIVKADNTYEVRIDNKKVQSGNLEDDWEFLPAKKIKDPEAKKPEDWDEKENIDDPEDSKPEDFEKPEFIPDPDADKPEDWDEEMDGEWEPPVINNPEYQGEWKPKQIPNPDYKGKWVHPEIDNPDYEADDSLYKYDDFGVLGFDLWQVKSGTIFDNILITDDLSEAEAQAKDLFMPTSEGEKTMKDKQDKEEAKKREEEEKKRKEEAGDEEEEEEEDEDEFELDGDTELEDLEEGSPEEDEEDEEDNQSKDEL